MTPSGKTYLDELRGILASRRHPDGRALGAALARRLGIVLSEISGGHG